MKALWSDCFWCVRKVWPWLLLFGGVALALEEWVLQVSTLGEGMREPETWMLVLVVVTSLVWSVAGNALLVLIVARELWIRTTGQTLPPFNAWVSLHFKHLLLESVRVVSWVGIWSFAFLIPGLIQYLRWIFVPYVVLLDDRYHRGELDALKRSEHLARGRWGKLFLFMVGFLIVSVSLQGLGQSFHWSVFQTPLQSVALQGVMQFVGLVPAVWLAQVYCRFRET